MIKIPYNMLINSTDYISDSRVHLNGTSARLNKQSFLKSKRDEFINSWSSKKRELKQDLEMEHILKTHCRKKNG